VLIIILKVVDGFGYGLLFATISLS
jgi:hypothetical protein